MTRLFCPICHIDLAISSARRHIGGRRCLENRFPHLKGQRAAAARRAKLEYDRSFQQARRDALRELQVGVSALTASVAAAAVEPTPEPAPTITQAALPPTPSDQPPRRARVRPVTIDVTGDDEDEEDGIKCPACLDAPDRPVQLSACGHYMCAHCVTLLVAHAMQDEVNPHCPLCREPIDM